LPVLWTGAPVSVGDAADADRYAWPFAMDRGLEFQQLITRTERGGTVWLTAYEHQHANEPRRTHGEFDAIRPYGLVEFRWDPLESTDGPYLWRAIRSSTCRPTLSGSKC